MVVHLRLLRSFNLITMRKTCFEKPPLKYLDDWLLFFAKQFINFQVLGSTMNNSKLHLLLTNGSIKRCITNCINGASGGGGSQSSSQTCTINTFSSYHEIWWLIFWLAFFSLSEPNSISSRISWSWSRPTFPGCWRYSSSATRASRPRPGPSLRPFYARASGTCRWEV